ncbi:two-component system response regulator [Burkholderia territorii]|uniref:Response regulator n=1 Tax=Burkholderia territorii TaxID=1503055 RepID=A0A102IXP2_9BURK|nr:response regulator [Burkholderia territorii]KAB0663462.1 response regulator [Burkholderia territorii]KUY94816.1 two-component system response regulator [Burkholderia territorii]KUZ04040.1 two-component system response regulator [Burkholderia territorii]KUZ35338.1 two-component system response regulator [Burkholderia territorii]KUZ46505.1 two-component system response regulator [Burkholderia territorii]
MNDNPLKHRVLLIEDDDRLARLVREYLDGYEFEVTVVRRGDLAVAAIREHRPALVILDLMLPHLDGMEVCRRMRAFTNVPVLILTARADVYDQIAGLEIGADDYVTKPIEPRVLVARARALLRRAQPAASEPHADTPAHELVFGELAISAPNRTVTWRGELVDLKTTEFNLLLILARSAGTVLSRDAILKQLRGIEFDGIDRSVDSGISKLRRRFEDASSEPQRIKTIWGRGYLFSPSAWDD